MNLHFSNRYVLNATLIVCWLATAMIGFNGFFKSHDLLTVSLFDYQIPDALTFLLAVMMFLSPVTGLFINVRIAKWLLLSSAFLYVVLIVFDLHRLTPYMIAYLGVFAALILLKYDSSILYTALLIIASGIYIFSGLHKLNIGFVKDIAPQFWFYSLPFNYNDVIGYGFAIIEIVAGLLLLLPLTRKLACIPLLLLHTVIIWKLGPWKLDWNTIVMPWNFLMIVTLIYLFRKSALSTFRIGSAQTIMVVLGVFFWLLPGLSQIIWIPENLSMMLYSGKSKSGYLVINEPIDRLSSYDHIPEKEKMLISLQRLSMEERGIAIHPELKIYDKILENFKSKIPQTDRIYYTHPNKISEKL
ncbi:DoxX family membrane protein [Nonlabens sp. Ci31]|uniref:MauE/DoxX family redox-associated membrane protein n=1 Tax=Nonlabens sp. Ci31 TaxID=2608253 RepID=UPI0014645C3F|nr:MauE/DoxX family redox-associated membrane protein [Nonlabens sp. Ci31]QJP33281.1 DoxX family membrane protein [Nonlabens sp. Ci31]